MPAPFFLPGLARPSGGAWGCHASVTLLLPACYHPRERQELLHRGGLFTLPLGCMSGVFSLQNFGRIWRKKEPDAQKLRLNKACSGRAAACGPREPDGAEGAEAVWLLGRRRGGRPAPRGGDSEGVLCSSGNTCRLPLMSGGCTPASKPASSIPHGTDAPGGQSRGRRTSQAPGHECYLHEPSQEVQPHGGRGAGWRA